MNREPTRRLFNGLAQLIVQSLDDSAGELVVEASAQGLAPARLVLPVRATAPIATQPASAAPYNTVNYWRISPHSDVRPDPNQALADFDMNTWEYGDPPMLCSTKRAAWLPDFPRRFRHAKSSPMAAACCISCVWPDGRKSGSMAA
jgi:beta-galactosidase